MQTMSFAGAGAVHKMRKIILIIGLLMMMTFVQGTSFLTKEDAISYFTDYKATREVEINKTVSTITYTSDKVCSIDYYSEKISCKICFDYLINGNMENSCVFVKEDSSLKEDEERIQEFVITATKEATLIEKVEYVEREMKDITKDIGLKEVD